MNNINHRVSKVDEIRKEIEKEEQELLQIRELVNHMKEKVVDKEPEHFSKRDILNAFFGSLIVGLTFIFKGDIIKSAINLRITHIEMIILSTFIILIAQIYFIGYLRVKDKSKRTFGEFMTKRLLTLYSMAVITAFFLIYIFNIDFTLPTFKDEIKMVILLSMPCSVGAAIPSLLKQY